MEEEEKEGDRERWDKPLLLLGACDRWLRWERLDYACISAVSVVGRDGWDLISPAPLFFFFFYDW